MTSRSIKQIRNLTTYAQRLAEKQEIVWQFETLLRDVANVGGATKGEAWLFGLLQPLLDEAERHLEELSTARILDESENILDLLMESLDDILWEEADIALAQLLTKRRDLTIDQQQYIEDIAECELLVEEAEEQLKHATAVKAAISSERQLLVRLSDIVARAKQALSDNDLVRFLESQRQWSEHQTRAKQLRRSIRAKLKESEPIAQTADMHVIQSPELDGRFEYTILLRPPVERDSTSVNVQGSTTIVSRDRESIIASVTEISGAINRRLVRSFMLDQAIIRGTVSVEQNGRHAKTAVGADIERHTVAIGEALRTFEPDDEEDDDGMRPLPDRPLDANTLVDRLGDLIYRLFIPDPMQGYFEDDDNMCSLSITTNDLELPWELMRHQNSFLCLERPIARMPIGHAMPNRSNSDRPPNTKLKFLLIYADPQRNLPLARNEILKIRNGLEATLGDRIDIDLMGIDSPTTGPKLNQALLDENYDVIHYAGHAQFNKDNSDLSSLLLDDGEYFAQKLRRLMKGRPLVFLNACETGQTANAEHPQRTSYHHRGRGMAEGLAAATIYGGAVGCIGPLWPVYDDAAAAFAVEFYNHVVEGHMLGKAMQLARQHVHDLFESQVTWASFVLYGNPTYKLVE